MGEEPRGRRREGLALTSTLVLALVVVHLSGVATSLELLPTGPSLEDTRHTRAEAGAGKQKEHWFVVGGDGDGDGGGDGDQGGGKEGARASQEAFPQGRDGGGGGDDDDDMDATAAARWERDVMSSAPPRRGGSARVLTHLQFTTACDPGTAVTHETGTCDACPVNHYASGSSALCRLPNVPFACSSAFVPNIFQDKYGLNEDGQLQVAANCSFGKDAASFIAGDIATCSFAEIGSAQCTPSALVDADGTVTFKLQCVIALEDPIFQNCVGLVDGTPAECTWAGKQENCTACPPRSACESTNTIDPSPCPMGFACPDGSTRLACASGSYAPGGVAACLNCPNGSTCPGEATKNPVICAARYFSGENATSCEACWPGHACGFEGTPWPVACTPGRFAASLAAVCSACEPGTSSDAGASNCYPCPAGTSCTSAGTASPAQCTPGTFAPAGSVTCTQCTLGQYQPEFRSEACLECPAGTRCPQRGISNLQTLQCQLGTFSRFTLNATAFTSLPYSHEDTARFPTLAARGDSVCRPCPRGYTCLAPGSAPALCPAGTIRLGANYTHCLGCSAGFSCATPDVPPAPCADGSFARPGAAACTPCAAGFYCPDVAVDLQMRCVAGSYSLAGAQGNCTTCPAGSACPNLDGTEIELCPPGTFATAGQMECTLCPPGHACPSTTDPGEMVLCQPGSFSPGGLSVCAACEAGFFQTKVGATSRALDCIACPLGSYSTVTAAGSNATCTACPVDTYCPLLGNAMPTACPVGLRTFGRRAATLVTACTLPPPPPPPSSPPPSPLSPPPPPLPPALAAGVQAPAMTVRLAGAVATFNRSAFAEGVATAVCCAATAADVMIVDVRAGSVVVDFYVRTPALYPVALGGGWNVSEVTRIAAALTTAIQNNRLAVGVSVLSASVEASCPAGTFVSSTLPGGTSVCDVCSTGTYSAVNNAPGCTACEPGYAAAARGMAACVICDAGSVAVSRAADACAPCAPGFAQSAPGRRVCDACADGFSARASGASTCAPCPAGHISGPAAWVGETPRMRADGRLSDEVDGAVHRRNCIENTTLFMFVADPQVEAVTKMTMEHVYVGAVTLAATLILMGAIGLGHWRQQGLLLKYAGGESFYDAMSGRPEEEDVDRRGFDVRSEKVDVTGVSEAIKAGNLDDAEVVIKRILARDPGQPETLHCKAVIHCMYGEYEVAKELVLRAMDKLRKPQFNNTMGILHMRLGNFEKAAGEFELATRRDPTLAVAYQNLGNLRATSSDLEGAKEVLLTALEKEPEYYKAMYNLALVNVQMGKVPEAKALLKHSIAVKHRALESHFNLGLIYLRENDGACAEQCFRRCLFINPKHGSSFVKLGNLQMTQGRPRRAVEQYLLGLEHSPDNAEAISNIGVVEWSKRNAVDAERHFMLALHVHRDYYAALYNMSLLCLEQGRVGEGADWYRRAVATKPASKFGLFQLGTALRRLGQLEGETPREEERSAAEKAMIAAEAERVAEVSAAAELLEEERAIKLQSVTAHATMGKRGASTLDDERKWERLVLVSSKVKGVDLLVRCALPKVGLVIYDHRASTLASLLAHCRQKLSTNAGLRQVDSIALITPSREGKVSLVKGAGLTCDSCLEADVSAFLEELLSMMNMRAHVFRGGSRLDFLLLDATRPANDALVKQIKRACGLQTVTASRAMAQHESYLLTDEQVRTAPTAAGARSAALYFDLGRLRPWARMPDAPMHHPMPQEEVAGDPVQRGKKSREEEAAERSALAVATNATKKLKGVGRAYAAYFRRRAQADGDPTGGEGKGEGEGSASGGAGRDTSAVALSRDGARSRGMDYAAKRDREDSALSAEAARTLAGFATPASRVLGQASGGSTQGSAPPTGIALFRKSAMLVRMAQRVDVKIRDPRTVTLDLLIEMDSPEFQGSGAQTYFVAELAAELDIHVDRIRVSAFDPKTSAVRLKIDDKPGDTPLDMVVSSLRVKLDSDTLLIDPSFGQLILTQVTWPEGWGEGAHMNSGIGGGASRSLGGSEGEGGGGGGGGGKEEGNDAASGGNDGVRTALASFKGIAAVSSRRLVLVSSRMLFADVLMESVEEGVGAVYFDWRFSSLDKIIYECKAKCAGEVGSLRSVGIMTHHKPGAIGLVKGLRTTRRNLVAPTLRKFWVELAQLMSPEGRVDILAYDSSTCIPTQRLLEELGDLVRVPICTTDAAAVALAGVEAPGGGGAAASASGLTNEDVFDAGALYFSKRRFAAWAAAAPGQFTAGTSKYRGRAMAKLGGGSRADGAVRTIQGGGRGLMSTGLASRGGVDGGGGLEDGGAGAGFSGGTHTGLVGAPVATMGDYEHEEGGVIDDHDLDKDPSVLAARQAARVAESRRREETRRQLAVMQNPQSLLRAVTAADGKGPAAPRRRQPVPFIPVERLVRARNEASGYDARLDRYAAVGAGGGGANAGATPHLGGSSGGGGGATKSAFNQWETDAEARREALQDDFSFVPTLDLPSLRIGGGAPTGVSTLALAAAPPRNARDAARRAVGVHATDTGQGAGPPSRQPSGDRDAAAVASASFARGEAIRWMDEGAINDAPAEGGAVGMDPNDPHAPKSKPDWDLDDNLRRWKKYENTGIWTEDSRAAGD